MLEMEPWSRTFNSLQTEEDLGTLARLLVGTSRSSVPDKSYLLAVGGLKGR